MKKNSIYIMLIFIFFMSACKKEESLFKFNDVGSNFVVTNSSKLNYTSLDNETRYSIVGFNITEVTVKHLGADKEDLGTYTLTDGKASISISDADMGLTTIGKTTKLTFVAKTPDGSQTITRSVTTKLNNPIVIDDAEVNHNAKTVYVKFIVSPVFATVTGVTIKTSVNSEAYADVVGTFNAEDSLAVKGSDYNVGDTLYVKVIGTTATKTVAKTAMIIVGASGYENTESFVLDTTENAAYDLVNGRFVNSTTASDSADIEYTITNIIGGYNVGFESNHNAEFVKVTTNSKGIYADADILITETTDFSTTITSDNDVALDDVYIFRTRRGVGEYTYGLMKAISVKQPHNESDNSSITFEFKY